MYHMCIYKYICIACITYFRILGFNCWDDTGIGGKKAVFNLDAIEKISELFLISLNNNDFLVLPHLKP